MAIAVKAKISIDGGQPLSHYTSIAIQQELFSHHSFRVVMPYEVLEAERGDGFFHQAHQKCCGKPISITLEPREGQSQGRLLFNGIVTHIALEQSADLNASFVLSGYSLTYLLEDGTQRRTFQKKDLRAIFNQVLGDYQSNVIKKAAPSTQPQEPVKYVVQYAESNYAFLRRLADTYGEWFYYDGQAIQLGQPSDGRALKYSVVGTESFTMGLSLLPAQFDLARYDYTEHKPHKSHSVDQKVSSENPFVTFALQTSEEVFIQPARLLANRHIRSAGQLDATVKAWKTNQASDMVTFQGNGENLAFGVGKVIEVEGRVGDRAHDYGKYRLTEVNHWIEDDMYHNTFTALPASAKQPGTNPYVRPPMGVPEIAEVIEVKDPRKLGRIRVRFQWPVASEKDAESGWMRVTTPYSGDGKGHLFTPEIGSQVLVTYEQGLTDFPVAIGNLFHPKNPQDAAYTFPDNQLKGLQTAGGNKFVLSDKAGEQTILISNSNKKHTAIELNFKDDGSITIRSKGMKGKVTIQSPKIELEAGASGEIMLHAKTIQLSAEGKLSLQSGLDSIALSAAQDVTADAKGNVKLTALQKATLAGTAGTEVTSSAQVEVGKGSLVNVSAGIIKLN